MAKKLGTLAALIAASSMMASCNGLELPNFKSEINYDNQAPSSERTLERMTEGIELLTVEMTYCTENNECEKGKSYGTGFVYSKGDNYDILLTAGHVILPEPEVSDFFGNTYRLADLKITIEDKGIELEVVTGELTDELDYGILRTASNEKLQKINAELGDSDSLHIGDRIYIPGHPYTLGLNLTDGILSAVNHIYPKMMADKTVETQFMYTTPISPGNSGSPIYAISGNKAYLIGIAIATYTRGQNLNIGMKINEALERSGLK